MKLREIPHECMELFRELRKDTTRNIHAKGALIRDLKPEAWRIGDSDRLVQPKNVWVSCYRRDQDEAYATVMEIISGLPEPVELPPLLDSLEVPYQDALLLSDVHLPYHDEQVLGEAIAFAKSARIRLCVLNGDILDLHWASSYTNLTGEDVGESFRQLGQLYVGLLDNGVTDILHNFGNHEDRILRLTGGRLGLPSLIALAIDTLDSRDRLRVRKAVRATNRHYVKLLNAPDGIDWVIGHPRRYRKKRLSLSSDIAQGRKLAHVATGHQHHFGVTITESGQYFAVDLPCTQDPERVEYLSIGIDPASSPVRGFGWLFDGVPGLWWSESPGEWKAWALEMAKQRGRFMKRRAKEAA